MSGPKPLSDTLALIQAGIEARHRKRIEAAARPGETFEQAETRLRAEDAAREQEEAQAQAKARAAALAASAERERKEAAAAKAPPSLVRKPPSGDEQADFFVSGLYDVDSRDSRGVMDLALFRISKRDKRAGEMIRYELPDGFVEVKAGPDGMASVWDYDIVLMMISHLTEAMNRYRDGKGEKPGRIFKPHTADILKFARRGDGTRQLEELEAALDRLTGTIIKISRERGRFRTTKSQGLIAGYSVLSRTDSDRISTVEIEVPEWIYNEVVNSKQPDVLTMHPDYFLIEPGIGRVLYRLARKAAGKGAAKWSFQTIYEHSGSTGTFKEFCRILRKIIAANDLPEYKLREEPGQSGPQLIMTSRDSLPALEG
ncbi:replication initiator protein A [Kerstersia gyiorum]|uniref:replication initiator protein A n=1 Tax=Kerstersia gyiorum TaxID=206506 RepID=UPI0020A05B60|nr:replication initiator protein A [Kerstersia gyiorum]MCP1680699.1 plasmid replication initiation protein [Kerstersia gyiorum]MCP1825233.1 plasmid replication initiation protein [Kerstersia gyiorum]MCP1828638.1 plasmid replication initiation protein [Kerstersia gyiorum]MCW2452274.1 plasmid replication initiation protein [Kerstersia gyiorum]